MRNKIILVFCVLLPIKCHGQAAVGNREISLRPVLDNNRLVGFSLSHSSRQLAEILFSSLRTVVAKKVEAKGDTLTFTGLTCSSGVSFGPASFVSVRPRPNEEFPEVTFCLDLKSFDSKAWQATYGVAPFHFLSCRVQGAQVLHQRGWGIPTPRIDPYPQLLAAPAGQQISALFSRDWTYCPPIGAYPVPVVGLWNADRKLYLGYEFQGARLTDHSERNVGSAYCYRIPSAKMTTGPLDATTPPTKDGEFFALTFPFSKGYQELVYPKGAETIASHFRLLFHTNLAGDDDPNEFALNWIFKTYSKELPGVPLTTDLSWLPAEFRLGSFPRRGVGRLLGPVSDRDPFQNPGNLTFWGESYESNGVDGIYARKETTAIANLKADLKELMAHASRVTHNGEESVYWRYPITGEWRPVYGPGVPTLHNMNGWQAALAFLDAYRNEPNPDYLPIIDGALRWSKHILYTRNTYDDVPAAQFCWHAGPAAAFHLQYYYTFRDDPQRRELAQTALKLARNLVYRNLPIWLSDNDESDDLDSTFLMEPNAGISWMGAACANEVWVIPYAVSQVYIATGDPILGHVLRGMMERWPVLFRDEWSASVAKYGGAFAERYGLYDGAQQAKGTRSSYGGLWGNFEQLAWPVGTAKARVLCGEKAAMAFCKEGNHTTLRDYRAAAGGNCSFRVVSWLSEEFDLMVTFPFSDLRGKTVIRRRNDDASIIMPVSFDERPDTLLLRKLANGDVVTIGDVPAEARPLTCSVAVPRAVGPRQVQGFHVVEFSRNANHELPEVWDDNASFAGLPKGERSIFGVPFWFNLRGPITARDTHVPVGVKATHLFCVVTGLKAGSRLTVRFANGGSSDASVGKAVPVVSGWPQCFDWHADLVTFDMGGREILSVWPQGCDLLAVTTTMKATKELTPVFAAVETRRKLLVAQQASLEELKRLAQPMSAFSGHLAILPVPPPSTASSSAFVRMLRQARAIDYFRILSPEEMVSSTVFDPAQYFLAVDVGGENYYQNVNGKEDGDRAIQGYLRGGGTLLVLSPGPFPFYYNEKGTPVVSAPKFGLPIAGSGLENRQDKLKGVRVSGWEKPPPGVKLTFEVNTTAKILPDLPAKFPFPIEGDPRWRPIVNVVSEPDVYTPLLTLKDGKGQSYGDGGAIVEFKSGELNGGRVVYVWGPLLSNEKYGSAILRGLLSHVLKTTFPPPARALVAHTSEKVAVDGDLSDGAWKQARELSLSRFLTGTGKPSQATGAKMLYDEKNLYVAFDCEDSNPQPKYAEHDANLWEGDVVEVYIDPSGLGKHYKEIEVNPANVVVDLDIAEVKNDAPQDVPNYKKWNCEGMQTATKLSEGKGWTAELAIPLRSLSDVAPKMGDSWRVQLYRIDRPKAVPEGEFVSWSSTRSFHVPDRFGSITFGGDPNGDDFSSYPSGSNAAPNWTVASGKWEVRDGVYLGSDCPGDGWRSVGALWGDDNLRDFTASLRFKILDFGTDWRDGPWIGLRQDTQGNGYMLCFNSWNVTLHKQSGSATTNDDHPLAMAKWTRDGEWHAVRITAKGNHFAVYLDDKLLMEATDDEALGAPAVPCGRLTLAARRWSQGDRPSRVAFDDVRVVRQG